MFHHSGLTVALAFWLTVIATDAFQVYNGISQIAILHRQPQQTASTIQRHYSTSNSDDESCRHQDLHQTSRSNTVIDNGRRKFLAQQVVTVMTGTLLTPLVAYADENEVTAEKLDTIIKEDAELKADISKEEAVEKKSINDEKQLINELSKEDPDETKVKQVTDELIKEEEQMKSKTEEMITKMETMESDLKGVGDDSASVAEEGFVEKLKERVEEEKDLISTLKQQSQKYIDPKTGKYKPMSSNDYRGKFGRLPQVKEQATSSSSSRDVDYTQYLKDGLKKNEDFGQEMENLRELVGKLGRRYVKLWKKIQGVVGQPSD